MKLSTRSLYGVRALMDLARHSANGPVLLKDVALRQDISLHYLEQLMARLVNAGLVRSVRGRRGGVQLNRPPGEIKIGDVIQVLEGPVAPAECVDNPKSCHRSRTCAVRDLWLEIKQAIDGITGSVTLQDLTERQESKEQAEQVMYYV